TVHALANVVRQPSDRQDVARAVKSKRVVSREPFLRHHLVADGLQPRIIGLEGMDLLLRGGGHRPQSYLREELQITEKRETVWQRGVCVLQSTGWSEPCRRLGPRFAQRSLAPKMLLRPRPRFHREYREAIRPVQHGLQLEAQEPSSEDPQPLRS